MFNKLKCTIFYNDIFFSVNEWNVFIFASDFDLNLLDSIIQPDTLLSWCQKQVAHNENIKIEDLSHSFKVCSVFGRRDI